jgi:hypothetical protein
LVLHTVTRGFQELEHQLRLRSREPNLDSASSTIYHGTAFSPRSSKASSKQSA